MRQGIFCIAVCLIFMLVPPVLAEATGMEWQACLGGSDFDSGRSIALTSGGMYILTGETYSTDGDVTFNHGMDDIRVVMLNPSGGINWQISLGGSLDDSGYSISETASGNFILLGNTYSNDGDISGNHGGVDIWVANLWPGPPFTLGNNNTLGGSQDDIGYSIKQTLDGGYILTGETSSNDGNVIGNHGGRDVWVVKLDPSLNLVWQNCLGGSGDDIGEEIVQTADGGYILTGETFSNEGNVIGNHGLTDMWVAKLDPFGNLIWQTCLGGTNYDFGEAIIQTSDGGYVVTGHTRSNDGDVVGNHNLGTYGSYDMWVVKLNAVGVIEWQKCLGGTSSEYGYSILPGYGGGYVCTGCTFSYGGDVSGNHGGGDMWVVRLDDSGTLAWQKCLGGGGADYAYQIAEGLNGGYAVIGETGSLDGDVIGFHGLTDLWSVKLNPESPTANFTAHTTAGVSPMTVQFNDTSLGVPVNWSWDFGTGDTSSEQNPVYTYLIPGTYTVTLTASNAQGSGTEIKTAFISVAPAVQSIDIPLMAGWNMVSVPLAGANLTVPAAASHSVYAYDPQMMTYTALDIGEMEPPAGYWVSASANCTLTANGTRVETYTTNLTQGWNMIGTVCNTTVCADMTTDPAGSAANYVYMYNPALLSYESETSLVPGSGYWISATADCILNVGPSLSG